jgi:hypothetical protein
LKFTENNYNLPGLGFADTNALDDLSDFFNFSQSPISFTPITPPTIPANCPTNSPPSDPDDD